jgi:hypothetical protein
MQNEGNIDARFQPQVFGRIVDAQIDRTPYILFKDAANSK